MHTNILIPQGKISHLVGTEFKFSNELNKFNLDLNNIDEVKEQINKIYEVVDLTEETRSSVLRELEYMQEDEELRKKVAVINDEMKIIQNLLQMKRIDSLKDRIKSKEEKYDLIKTELDNLIKEKAKSEKELNELRQDIEDNVQENSVISEDTFKDLTSKRMQLSLEYDELRIQFDEKEKEKIKLIERINSIKETINKQQTNLEDLKPKLEELKEKEKSLMKNIQLKKYEINQLYKPENNEMKENQQIELNKSIESLKIELNDLEKHIAKLENRRDEKSTLVEELNARKIELSSKGIEKDCKEMNRLKAENLNYETERCKLLTELDHHENNLMSYKERKRGFYPLLGRAILRGKENLDKVVQMFREGSDEEKKIADNYYGWFVDNITYEKTFMIPVERTSKHYLSKHIVKDSATATRLLQKFNELKLDGVCDFVPLNLLKLANLPDDANTIHRPLFNLIGYEKNIERAAKHCFQRVHLCRSIEEVIALKKDYTFVTLNGDLLLRKKALDGGYIDKRTLWLEQYSKYQICERILIETEEKLNNLKKRLQTYENKLQENRNKLNDYEQMSDRENQEKDKLLYKLSELDIDLKELNPLIKNYKQIHKRKLIELESLESKLNLIVSRSVIVDEKERLDRISSIDKELEQLNSEYKLAVEECNALKLEVKNIKYNLRDNLLKQQTDSNDQLKQIESEVIVLQSKASNFNSTIKILEDTINRTKIKSDSNKIDLELTEKKKQVQQLEQTIKSITYKEGELKFSLKNNLQLQKTYKDELNLFELQIEQMGDRAAKYMDCSSKILLTKLHDYQDKLDEIGPLKKSIISFEVYDQRYNLVRDLFDSYFTVFDSAKGLFKSEIKVERSLQTLSLFCVRFQEIFNWFRPKGSVNVQIKVPESKIKGKNNKIRKLNLNELYSTVFVSFNGEVQRKIDFLSGGQRTILSLCYLLTILTLKPQPFLLIDETDQNLDESTCIKLSKILKEHFSNTIQFFFSSHRTYFAPFANKIYQVSIDRNQSLMHEVELDYWTTPENTSQSSSIKVPTLTNSQSSSNHKSDPEVANQDPEVSNQESDREISNQESDQEISNQEDDDEGSGENDKSPKRRRTD